MKLRIYETNGLDLDTVVYMLYQADKQANFHPDSLWILSASDGEINNYNQDETGLSKKYIELCVKWIGREAVVMWLLSNQVNFEIVTHEFLEEELEAIGELKQENEKLPPAPALEFDQNGFAGFAIPVPRLEIERQTSKYLRSIEKRDLLRLRLNLVGVKF